MASQLRQLNAPLEDWIAALPSSYISQLMLDKSLKLTFPRMSLIVSSIFTGCLALRAPKVSMGAVPCPCKMLHDVSDYEKSIIGIANWAFTISGYSSP